jgi:hypothetical protein
MTTINITTNIYIFGEDYFPYNFGYSTSYYPPLTYFSFPLTIINNTGNNLVVEFVSLTFRRGDVGPYSFICGSSNLTFTGNAGLNGFDIRDYPGMIQNGTSSQDGKDNITIQNLTATMNGYVTTGEGAGLICQAYFGRGALNNIINNCSSSDNGCCGGDSYLLSIYTNYF